MAMIGIELGLSGESTVSQGLQRVRGAMDGLGNSAATLGRAMGLLGGAFAGVASLQGFIRETIAAQQEQAQLAAVLKSTGQAAGWSQQQLNAMAEQMARSTTFTSGEINTAQTRLLSYTGIVGEQVPKAMQAVANMSARMGMDLSSAAEQIGRALDVPSQGLTALTRQGFRFSESQQEMIKSLEESGKVADAQNIILEALESSYGGAAEAARDTLGGALKDLQKAVQDLMTGGDGSLSGMRAMVEATAASVRDANAIFGAMQSATEGVGDGFSAAALAQDAFATVLETVAVLAANVTYVFKGIGNELGGLAAQAVALAKLDFAGAGAIREAMVEDAERARKEVDRISENILNARARLHEKLAQPIDYGKPGEVRAPTAAGPSKEAMNAANKELAEQAKLIAELAGLTGSFYADWDRLNVMFKAGKLSVDQLTEAQAKLLEKQPAIKAAAQEQAKLQEAANKAADREIDAIVKEYEAMEKAQAAVVQARQNAAQSAQQALQKLQDENEARRMAASMSISQAKAIELINLRRLEEQRTLLKGQGGHKEEIAALEQEIATRKKLVEEIGARDVQDAAAKAAQDAAAEWQKTADQINQSLTDALMRGFESGKDFAKNMRDTVVNMFKTMVLKPVIQMVLNPISVGLAGILGGGSAMAGQGGGLGGLLGMASNASSAYNMYSGLQSGQGLLGSIGGFFGMGSGTGATVAAANGLSALTPVTIGTNASVVAPVVAGQSSIMGSLSAAAPWIAGAFGVAAGLGLFRQTHKRGDVLTGTLGVDDGIRSGDLMRKDGFLFGGPDWFVNDTGVSGMNKAIQAQWGASLKTVEQWSKTLGLSTDKIEGFTTTLGTEKLGDHGQLGIRLDKDGTPLSDQEIQAKIAEAIRSGSNELAQQLIGSWADAVRNVTSTERTGTGFEDYSYRQVTRQETSRTYTPSEFARDGEQAIDTLTRLGTSIVAANGAFRDLGFALYEATMAGGDAASSFIDLVGGMDQFIAASSTFYQNFYSDEERRANAIRKLNTEFDKLGLQHIDWDAQDARQQFRALVESQQALMMSAGTLASEAAEKTTAALLNLSGAAAEVTQAADAAAQSLEQARQALIDSAVNDFQRAASRDRQILQAQLTGVNDAIKSITNAVQMLRQNADKLYGDVESTSQAAAARGMVYIEDALQRVRAGASIGDFDGLSDAVKAAVDGISKGVYVSQFERERDALVLAGQLTELGDLGDSQLSIEERQLRALQGQLEYLDTLSKRAEEMVNGTTALTETVDTYFARLMAFLDPEKPAAEAGKPGAGGSGGGGGITWGGPSNISSKYTTPVGGYTGGTIYAGVSLEQEKRLDQYAAGYHAFDGTGDAAGLNQWIKDNKLTPEDLSGLSGLYERDWENWFKSNGIPAYAVGTNYVPRTGPALLHEGEAVIPKAYNPWANGQAMNGGDPELLAEMRAMRAELAALRAASAATANNTAGLPQMADQFDAVTNGGNAMRAKALA